MSNKFFEMKREDLRIQLVRRYIDSLTDEERFGMDADVLVGILTQKPEGVSDLIQMLHEV